MSLDSLVELRREFKIMKKTLTIAIGIMLLTFPGALVFAKSGLDVATPKAEEQSREQPSDLANTNSQATSGNVSISKRNKAKLELEQQKILKQKQINKEKAAETVQQ
jgi:hypothetical protein